MLLYRAAAALRERLGDAGASPPGRGGAARKGGYHRHDMELLEQASVLDALDGWRRRGE